MSPLASRKQLLIAAAELHRAQLAGDVTALTMDARALAGRAKSISALASSAALVIAGLVAWQRARRTDDGAKRSWPQTLLKGAGVVSTFWLAFHSPPRDQAGQPGVQP